MDIFASVESMRPWIAQRDWRGLEEQFGALCRAVDPAPASTIGSIDLTAYRAELADGLARTAERLGPRVRAVAWEFDPDNDWASAFYLCTRYRPERVADDDWASDFGVALAGPSMPDLAAQLASTWNGADEVVGRNAYLIARTVAAIGSAAEDWSPSMPLCAGFHDQDVLFRIRTVPDVG